MGSLEPGYAYAWRGHCSYRMGRRAEAAAEYDIALKLSPQFWGTRVDRARVYQELGKHVHAIDDLTIVLKLAQLRKDPWFWELRAASHAALGNDSAAEADRKSARDSLKPADAKDLNARAWRLVQGPKGMWDPEHAEALARHATLMSPQMATYWNTLGVAKYRLGRFGDAISSFHKSLARDTTDAEGFDLFFLAMCHARQGDSVAAQACFAQAARWMTRQKNLPATWASELREFREEAEAVLKDAQATSGAKQQSRL